MAAMISPTSRPNAAPVHTHRYSSQLVEGDLTAVGENNKNSKKHSPMRKTGMKAPQGTGMVVATADIQN